MPFFQKPENALKRAQELQDVGKPELALEVLHDIITSRRHRAWTQVHERIMIEYINLCIDMRKGRQLRDVLHQYKNIVANTALVSLDVVVRHYIKAAEDRVENARGVVEKVVLDFEDLEASETPEGLLMMMVSDEDNKDRTDRQVLTPWLKFLWEAYRTVLDILRNNARLESLYQSVSQLALQFCLKYERKPEFHRLCDLLRYHLQQVLKYQSQAHSINLNSQESFNAHLQTRFMQLDVASKLELWQEAFKAIEDISYLMEVSDKSPKPQMLADYYSKLATVFWRSQQYLYLAASLLKLFQLSKEQKKSFSAEEAQSLASKVLLAVLSCPLKSSQDSTLSSAQVGDQGLREMVTDRNQRLVTLLGVDAVPTRESLVQEMNATNILKYVDPELRGLYALVERQFHPLDLCKKVQPVLAHIAANDSLAQYVAPLQSTVTMRLLKQLSQVYASMKMSRLCQLIPFYTEAQIEQSIVRAVKERSLQVRICHRTRSIFFATNVFVVESESATQEGPQLQLLQSQMMTDQLTTVCRRLREAVDLIDPSEGEKAAAARRAAVYEGITSRVRAEHRAALERKGLIEMHKERLETEAKKLEDEERKRRDEEDRKRKEKEDEEAKKAASERKIEELQERQKLQSREFLSSILKKPVGQRILEKFSQEELEKRTHEELAQLQQEFLEKELREQVNKLKTQEKNVDYFERAKHKTELPLLEEEWNKYQADFARQWQEQQQARVEQAKKEHENALLHRDRLRRMVSYQRAFMNSVLKRREGALAVEMAAYQAAVAQHEAARKQYEEEQRRLAEEREAAERQRLQELEERRRIAEEEEKARLEAERKAQEEREQREKERQEREEKEKKKYRPPGLRDEPSQAPTGGRFRREGEGGGEGSAGSAGGRSGGEAGPWRSSSSRGERPPEPPREERREERDERRGFGERSYGAERRDMDDRRDRPYGGDRRDFGGERRDYGAERRDRPYGGGGGGFDDRRGERRDVDDRRDRSYGGGDRRDFGGERRDYGAERRDRPYGGGGGGFDDRRGERRDVDDRRDRPYGGGGGGFGSERRSRPYDGHDDRRGGPSEEREGGGPQFGERRWGGGGGYDRRPRDEGRPGEDRGPGGPPPRSGGEDRRGPGGPGGPGGPAKGGEPPKGDDGWTTVRK